VLTLRGGPELVAFWAQLGSVVDLVAGVALAGVGTGISVLVAQADALERQRGILRESLRLGVATSAPVMLAVAAVALVFPERVAGSLPAPLIALAAVVGCVAVIPGMVNGYWLGQQRRDWMLFLAVGSAAVQLAAAFAAPQRDLLVFLTLALALPALALMFIFPWARPPISPDMDRDRGLRRYLLPGLTIGVLTPLGAVAARDIVSAAMSWHEVGLLQALWRVSDWVGNVAAGVMAVHFLPRLAAARGTPRFAAELRRAALVTIVPSAIALAAIGALHGPVFALLYDETFRMNDATVALFFSGTLARIASWLPLYALYAMRRTGPLVVGEFLSMPLFAALLAAYPRPLSLEAAGALWLAAYAGYGLFNLWAVRRASASL